MIAGLDHVQVAIPIGGEAAARPFYIDLLGFCEIEKPKPLRGRGGLWLQAGAAQLHLGVQGDFLPATKAHPAFLVVDLSALAVKLEEAGVLVIWDDSVPHVSRFFISDPFGNRLELIESTTRFNPDAP